MTVAPIEPQSWAPSRWIGVILLILTVHLALIFWLSRQKPAVPSPIVFGPSIYLPPSGRSELPAVENPALYLLANRRGFSGRAWMKVSELPKDVPDWTEPARPLSAPPPRLASTLDEFMRTNQAGTFELAPRPEPPLVMYLPLDNPVEEQSTLTVEGDLARRRLLSQFKLDPWPPVTDILTNSVVQAGVDEKGNVFSAVLLVSSGSRDADASAVSLAGNARFQPLRWTGPGEDPETRLQWGRLVFHWHTIPAPATNNGPAASQPSSNAVIIAPHE